MDAVDLCLVYSVAKLWLPQNPVQLDFLSYFFMNHEVEACHFHWAWKGLSSIPWFAANSRQAFAPFRSNSLKISPKIAYRVANPIIWTRVWICLERFSSPVQSFRLNLPVFKRSTAKLAMSLLFSLHFIHSFHHGLNSSAEVGLSKLAAWSSVHPLHSGNSESIFIPAEGESKSLRAERRR